MLFPVAARWTETLTALTSVRWHRNRRRYELVLVLPAGLEAAAIVGALTGVRTIVAPSGLLDLAWLSGLLRAEVVVLHDGRSPVGQGWLDEITTALALHPQAGEVTFDPPQRAAAALPAPDVDGRGNGAPPADRRPGIRALWRHQLGRAEAGGSFSVALSGGRAQAGPQRETRRTTGPEP